MSEARQEAGYFNLVWESFLYETGQCRMMSPAEWHTLKRWHAAGIPLRIVLRAFQDCEQKARTLDYYDGPVERAGLLWRRNLA